MQPLLGDGQDSKEWNPRVGQRLVPSGHIITQEDLDAAAAQHRYVNATLKIVQAADMKAGGSYSFMPQLTEQEIKGPFGGTTKALLRKAYAAGRYVVPRRYNTGSERKPDNFTNWNQRWNVAREALGAKPSTEAVRAAQIKLLQGDANLYRYVTNSPTNFTDPTGLMETPTGGPTILGPDMHEWHVDGYASLSSLSYDATDRDHMVIRGNEFLWNKSNVERAIKSGEKALSNIFEAFEMARADGHPVR
jgi:hypothetical protein